MPEDVERIAILEWKVSRLEDRLKHDDEAKEHGISIWKAAIVGMMFTVLTHILIESLHYFKLLK